MATVYCIVDRASERVTCMAFSTREKAEEYLISEVAWFVEEYGVLDLTWETDRDGIITCVHDSSLDTVYLTVETCIVDY